MIIVRITGKEVDFEKNSDHEGAFDRFLRRVYPDGMFRDIVP